MQRHDFSMVMIASYAGSVKNNLTRLRLRPTLHDQVKRKKIVSRKAAERAKKNGNPVFYFLPVVFAALRENLKVLTQLKNSVDLTRTSW
jgi:hypothetical protein